jgi:hypothetical protein
VGDAASEDDCVRWLVKRLFHVLEEPSGDPQLRAVCIDALLNLATQSEDAVSSQFFVVTLTDEVKRLTEGQSESVEPILSCLKAITQLQVEAGCKVLVDVLHEAAVQTNAILLQALLHALTTIHVSTVRRCLSF